MDREAQILAALQELRAWGVVHPNLVVTPASGEAILQEIEQAKPTDVLRTFLRDREASHGGS
jgi:hypothetical protein